MLSQTSPVAMITGGNRGIGRGITDQLLADGWRVSIMATRPLAQAGLDELVDHDAVHYTQGSVDDVDAHRRYLDDTLAAFGVVNALINNAGVAPTQRDDILTASPESFDRVLSINLRGPYFLTQLVANQMLTQPIDPTTGVRATIVNVSSISAEVVSTNRGEYCISKAGAAMATKLWAARLAPEAILVYEVRPGVIATDMTAGVKQRYDDFFAADGAPMPRWGTPADVAGAVAQLVAGQMPYSTGEVIHVDGGMHIGRL